MTRGNLTVGILAGGNSTRFKSEKALASFNGAPLITHMINIAKKLCDSILIAAGTDEQKELIRETTGPVEIVVDPEGSTRCALNGAVTVFEYSKSKYTMLLPVDTPFVNLEVMKLLYDLVPGHGAVVPIWPSGYVEPLHAVYLTEHAYAKGLQVLERNEYRMTDLLQSLSNVLNVSTLVLKQFDSELHTFLNANTEEELGNLERMPQR